MEEELIFCKDDSNEEEETYSIRRCPDLCMYSDLPVPHDYDIFEL